MARGFAKVSEEEIEEAFFYPSDLVNTKTTISLRVGEERWIYTSTLRVSVYIHHYSPPLRAIVVYYSSQDEETGTSKCCLQHLGLSTVHCHEISNTRDGALPEKLGRGVGPASQDPYPTYDQNLRFSLPYL